MSAVARARRPPSPAFLDPPGYARHRPERTLLYQLVEQHYPAFRELRAAADRPLPDFVQQEFEAYLKCGRLEEGFLRVGASNVMPRSSWRSAARSVGSARPAAGGAWPRPRRCWPMRYCPNIH